MATNNAINNKSGSLIIPTLNAVGTVTTDSSGNLSTVSAITTWTPTLGDGTTNFIASAAVGQYYQTGPLIHFQTRYVWTSKNGVTAQLRFSVPVAIGASCTRASMACGYTSGLGFTGSFVTAVGSGGDLFFGIAFGNNTGTPGFIQASSLGNSGEIEFGGFYWTI